MTIKPLMANPLNLHLWQTVFLEDQYDDASQTARRKELGEDQEKVLGGESLRKLKNLISLTRPILDVGCGSGAEAADVFLDPSPHRAEASDTTQLGWMENMGLDDSSMGTIICWGTFCFLRSPIEALIEANRVLAKGGHMIFDVVVSTTMPLCQTVHGTSFMRHLALHGFDVVASLEFGHSYHQRLGILIKKVREWSPDHFRMPQAMGDINNYLPERDWYMR